MADRFYQLKFPHRDVFWQDLGSVLRIEGLVIGGGETGAVLMLSSADMSINRPIIQLSDEDLQRFIQFSDQPEIMIGPAKIFQRKVRYEVSGHVQQKIWRADGYKCYYCSRQMGEVQLSIDHFIPLEAGGANDQSNYLSACRKCNKDKGNMDPQVWCDKKNLNYEGILTYLRERKV
jgi:hypothetical protein